MPRNDIFLRLAAAIVGIAALAVAAATVRSPTESGRPGADGSGDGAGAGQPPPEEPPTVEFSALIEYLVVGFLILVAIAIAWFLVAHRRELVRTIGAGLVALLLIVLLTSILFEYAAAIAELLGGQEPQPEMDHDGDDLEGIGGEGEATDETISIPMGPILVLLTVVTAIFVGAFLLSNHREEDVPTDATGEVIDPDSRETENRTRELATAAGRAADRIESTDDIDNEIYRAWVTMTAPLDVSHPESSTPGEFALAAVDAGMESEHVSDLTRLFEDVRYGHTEPTEKLESRARSVLRRIEETYAPDESEGNDSPRGSTDSRTYEGESRRSGRSPRNDGRGSRGDGRESHGTGRGPRGNGR